MLGHLLGRFDHIVFTRYLSNPRAVRPEELQALALELSGRHYHACAEPAEAWNTVGHLAGPEDLICIAGSIRSHRQEERERGADGRCRNPTWPRARLAVAIIFSPRCRFPPSRSRWES
jgi:hypothetical protein